MLLNTKEYKIFPNLNLCVWGWGGVWVQERIWKQKKANSTVANKKQCAPDQNYLRLISLVFKSVISWKSRIWQEKIPNWSYSSLSECLSLLFPISAVYTGFFISQKRFLWTLRFSDVLLERPIFLPFFYDSKLYWTCFLHCHHCSLTSRSVLFFESS